MSGRAAQATAPTRIDLAGAPLDIWPLYLFHPRAVTLSVAIDRRAWCRVETGVEGVQLYSKDTLQKVEGRSLSEVRAEGDLRLVTSILRALGVETGVKVETQSRVAAGSGLGGASALAVAVAAAVTRAFGRDWDQDGLWPIVRDAETECKGVPAGIQDFVAALHGGVLGVRLDPGDVRVERLTVDPAAVEEALLLFDPGVGRSPAPTDWDLFKGQIEGDARVRGGLAEIARLAAELLQVLETGRLEDVAGLIRGEWEAHKALAGEVTAPEIDRIAEAAAAAGGAAKACGAGCGRIVAVWARPGQRDGGSRERAAAALREAGLRSVPFRVDLRGLEVD
jgi:D-glycero-alpha-D-manno-heptose-7-phosphate kinase